MDKNEIAKTLQALSDQTRLDIIYLLGQKGPKNVNEISANFKQISRPAISHHLKILKDAKIVKATKKGQEVEYTFERKKLVGWLTVIAQQLSVCDSEDEETEQPDGLH